ncbi:hypothetical protein [Jeotgalibaca arthritidis]|uniref:Polymer-forming cytoskeletal protein n=1 Tax=Jeotgalibaca arthritidis TaxID=1868794 RepID=A0A6G7K860_9LACT|nr:hypothetical protein [Jeotgalibaca arthritidis]QII81438.1 hypothetical protein G7057_02395 [Jeotgalibaca arthritidis]
MKQHDKENDRSYLNNESGMTLVKEVTINNLGIINGVFLTDSSQVSYSGGNFNGPSEMVMIAPYAEVKLSSHYSIHGTIVAKTIKLNGQGTIEFNKEIDTSGFLMASGESVSPTLEDLIESGPIIETQGE